MSLSCVIVTKNDASNILRLVSSVKKIAKHIFVLDISSTDDTLSIVSDMGVLSTVYDGSAFQCIISDLVSSKWVLVLNGNEELSSALQLEIQYIFASHLEDKYKAYAINVIPLENGDIKPSFFSPKLKSIRLFSSKYSYLSYNCSSVIDDASQLVVADKEILSLKEAILQRPFLGLIDAHSRVILPSINHDSKHRKSKNHPKAGSVYLLFSEFFHAFIAKRYCIFGINGFVIAMLHSIAELRKHNAS